MRKNEKITVGRRRVVVTGLGAITPLGTGVDKSWQALCAGISGITRITGFDPSKLRTQIAGQVKDFSAEDFVEKKLVRKMNRYIHFALAAAGMAMEDSRFKISSDNEEAVGVVIATTSGGVSNWEQGHELWLKGIPEGISPFLIPNFMTSMAAGQVAIRFGAKGPNFAPTTACAASTHAIGDSVRLIQRGDCDAVIAGGSESGITPVGVAALGNMRATSTRNDEPEKASRPFDNDRDGFVTGEGAGIVILEEFDSALERGARIYAEVLGYGANSDAYHITSPSGEGAIRCMRLALKDAGIAPQEIDYINAHGTSTVLNDRVETHAIKEVFGEHSRRLAISSNKSMIGHLWGAAGAVEVIFTILTMKDSNIPPTINYETPDPECDLDYVPNVARKVKVRTALSNSFGFGGANGVLVLREFTGE
ncbi:MAG: beta-ketoacyl-[acyl-carrier-protein] synthase II [Deltaproteobacteria bacterium]|nr:MAG: beta-ketoacyl-[acyl-carrier-protein] synthase II [Deltaproteobacteria bacterium]